MDSGSGKFLQKINRITTIVSKVNKNDKRTPNAGWLQGPHKKHIKNLRIMLLDNGSLYFMFTLKSSARVLIRNNMQFKLKKYDFCISPCS
jgi:hypothetical protein